MFPQGPEEYQWKGLKPFHGGLGNLGIPTGTPALLLLLLAGVSPAVPRFSFPRMTVRRRTFPRGPDGDPFHVVPEGRRGKDEIRRVSGAFPRRTPAGRRGKGRRASFPRSPLGPCAFPRSPGGATRVRRGKDPHVSVFILLIYFPTVVATMLLVSLST